jgi:hypothetical protein
MAPRHFWWLLEAQAETTKRPGLDDDDRTRLMRVLKDAKKGKV